MTISVVINVKNGEPEIEWALRSVIGWADEVVVADMHSVDGTREIAQRLGARVITVPDYGFVEPARAEAVKAARGDWILILDADEVVSRHLASRIRQLVRDSVYDAVDLPFETFIFGARMRGTGWGPGQDHHVRLFRRAAVTFSPELHEPPSLAPSARLLRLEASDGCIVHFNYRGSDDFITKLNRYTSTEASRKLSQGSPVRLPRVAASAAREFLHRYLTQRGYRDGWRGLYLSFLMAAYRIIARAKQLELQEFGPAGPLEHYRRVAEHEISDG